MNSEPTTVNGMTYTIYPTEPDRDVIGYTFDNEPDVWDYATETLGYEYGMDAVDIDGTLIYGYHSVTDGLAMCGYRHYRHEPNVCRGHIIATVTRT